MPDRNLAIFCPLARLQCVLASTFCCREHSFVSHFQVCVHFPNLSLCCVMRTHRFCCCCCAPTVSDCNRLTLKMANICNQLPRVSKKCKNCCQSLPFVAKVAICCQNLSFLTQNIPFVAICCQKLSCVAKSFNLFPKVAKSCTSPKNPNKFDFFFTDNPPSPPFFSKKIPLRY